MSWILAFIVVLVVVSLISAPFYFRRQRQLLVGYFTLAERAFQAGNFSEACYRYVVLVGDKEFDRNLECSNKVRDLWKNHGPFQFDELISKDMEQGTALYSHGSEEESFSDLQKLVQENLKKVVG
jgi:hypothetical protein